MLLGGKKKHRRAAIDRYNHAMHHYEENIFILHKKL